MMNPNAVGYSDPTKPRPPADDSVVVIDNDEGLDPNSA